jgi:hypothetical protein
VLVMSYLEPSRYVLWKQALRDGHADAATARAVGRVLARIHAFSAARPELAAEFATDPIFFDIRLEPYLLATAARHPTWRRGSRRWCGRRSRMPSPWCTATSARRTSSSAPRDRC